MNLRKLYTILTISVFFFLTGILSIEVNAQIPTVQDCMGAIPVCNVIYTQPIVYQGQGNYPNEVNPNQQCPKSCMDGEKNAIWYVISVKTGGLLRFVISPVNTSDDYDWAVFNLNTLQCSDIYNNAQAMQKSCNAAGGAGYHGATGISTASGGSGNCNGGGPTNKWNADLPVQTGDTYVLCVSNWTPGSSAGYTLDFSASTADIFDDVPAFINEIDTVRGCSGSATLAFAFNENILCNSMTANDFIITGPDGTVHTPNSYTGEGCDAGGTQGKFFTLSGLYPPIVLTGTYTLTMVGQVTDLCNNTSAAPPKQFYAEIDPLPTIDQQPQNALVPIGGTATLSLVTSGANTWRWQIRQSGGGLWSNIAEGAPYAGTQTQTLTISNVTFDMGQYQFRCVASGTCSPPASSNSVVLIVGDALAATASANPEVICIGASSTLGVQAFGGNTGQPYSYTWSSPEGVFSNLMNPQVEPTQTTTYSVLVDDGYNPITVNVTVVVNPLPVVDAGPNKAIFHGTQTQLNGTVLSGTSPYQYVWQPANMVYGNTEQNPYTKQLTESTNFFLTVTDANHCVSAEDMVTINIIGGPLTASPSAYPPAICYGESSQLFALPSGGDTLAYSFSWLINGNEFSTSANPVINPTETTTYTLHLEDGSNSVDRNVTVIVNSLPLINFYKPEYHVVDGVIQVCVFDTLYLECGFQNGVYLWSNGSTDYSIFTATAGISFDYQEHSVKVTNPVTGCVSRDTVGIAFTFSECTYGLPELTLNDLVKIFPNPAKTSVTISIDGPKDNFLIEIADLRGRTMLRQEIRKPFSGIYNHTIDVSSFSNTTCIIRLSSNRGNIVRKLLISK